MDESRTSRVMERPKVGTNPNRATFQTHPDSRTHPSQNPLFDKSKVGLFVTGFDAREYERAATILNPEWGVRCDPKPDFGKSEGEMECKRESIPVCPFSERELGSTGGSH